MRSTLKLITGIAAIVFAGQAFADLAATHIIENSVTVDWLDAGGGNADSDTATVQVTVNLVDTAANVTFDATASDPLDPVGVGEQIDLVYQIYSEANGLDTYTVVPTDPGTPGDVSYGTLSPTSPISLAATTSNAAVLLDTTSSAQVVTVPADGTADGTVNGFDASVGEKAVVGSVLCDVTAVDDTNGGVANASSSITLDNCVDLATQATPTTQALTVGMVIGEYIVLTVPVTGVTAGDADVTLTVTSGGGGGTAATGGTQTVVVAAPNVQVFKFVRNTDTGLNSSSCTGTTGLPDADACIVFNGKTYYADGVTADPGDILEYAIVVVNSGAKATSVQVSDAIVAFTSFSGSIIEVLAATTSATPNTGSDCLVDGATCTITGTITNADSVDGVEDDPAELISNTVEASAGDDGAGSPVTDSTSGGELENDEYSVVAFPVQVQP